MKETSNYIAEPEIDEKEYLLHIYFKYLRSTGTSAKDALKEIEKSREKLSEKSRTYKSSERYLTAWKLGRKEAIKEVIKTISEYSMLDDKLTKHLIILIREIV